ncbi:MAG: OpgC domain-containing protein [Candidatus Sulfotelmatobacter sp.]
MNYTMLEGAKLLSAKMKRFIEFDVLRGVLLLMMSVDHSPSSLRRFTDQPLGFFSTAECFVFVSAFLAGMLFRKRAEKLGFAAARSSSIHRAGRIYRAHLVTLCFAFVLGSFFLSELPGIRNLLDHYLMDPWAAIGGSLVLLFRPPLMDILPMYVLFSLLTPAAFGAAQRWGWKTVLFVSFSAWVIAQTHVRDMLVNSSKDLSFVQLGPFDLLAWQFLWVGGLFIGQRFLENKSLLPMPHQLRPLLVLSAMAFLSWRWISITSDPDPITQTWLFDKWHLGPLRLINFAVAASVTATFLKYLNRWEAPLRPFLLIGRHMLPVFCSQICLSVLLIGGTESGLTIEPITSALVICQLLTAPLFAWFLELRSVAKQSARPITPALGAKHQISLAETGMKRHPLPSRTVRQPVLHPL